MLRQLVRQGVLSDLDIEAMADALEADGMDDEALAVGVAYIEACGGSISDGGNDSP